MTTLREAAQMALDALEYPGPSWPDARQKAAEALRAALAAPLEQEPVAWMYDWYDETEDIDGVPIGGIVSDCISKDYDEAHSPTMGCHNIRPLYTAPPQREWKGLTDAEVRKTVDDYFEFDGGDMWGSYLAIEAKLREKNS